MAVLMEAFVLGLCLVISEMTSNKELEALQRNPSSFAACSFVLLEEVVVITVPIFVTMPVMTGNEPITIAVLLLPASGERRNPL